MKPMLARGTHHRSSLRAPLSSWPRTCMLPSSNRTQRTRQREQSGMPEPEGPLMIYNLAGLHDIRRHIEENLPRRSAPTP